MDIYYTIIDSPIGRLTLVGRDGFIIGLLFPDQDELPEHAREVDASEFGGIAEKTTRYLSGEPVDLSDLPVEFDGVGPFEERVLRETMKVPFGELISYAELAILAGSPGAARAAGNAMRKNPIPILVPCHRVVHSDGGIGGYAGGLDLKRRLLAIEGVELC